MKKHTWVSVITLISISAPWIITALLILKDGTWGPMAVVAGFLTVIVSFVYVYVSDN